MRVQTADLNAPALDYLVTKLGALPTLPAGEAFSPSTNWSHAGRIITRRGIGFRPNGRNAWTAYTGRVGIHGPTGSGPDHLIAAMRCVVVTDYGPTADVPDELLALPPQQDV